MSDRPQAPPIGSKDGGNGGSTLFGEFKRMARTSGAVGGIAARVAGNRVFGIKTDKAAHAEDLKAILGGLKGPLMKVAQFLSTVPDALPPEYAAELAELQANAPPHGLGVRQAPHAVGAGCGLAIEIRPFQPGRRRRRQPGPGASGDPAGWHRCRLQAAISRYAERGRSRSSAVETGAGGVSPHG